MSKKSKRKIKSNDFREWILLGIIILILLFAASFIFQDKLGKIIGVPNEDSLGELRQSWGYGGSGSGSGSGSGCIPSCYGKVCGDDGCGGDCGSCTRGIGDKCVRGKCVCTPNCGDKECGGDDGCGNSCGPYSKSCSTNFGTCTVYGFQYCNYNTYEYGDCQVTDPTTATCAGHDCGADGCGGDCSRGTTWGNNMICCGTEAIDSTWYKCCSRTSPYPGTTSDVWITSKSLNCPSGYTNKPGGTTQLPHSTQPW